VAKKTPRLDRKIIFDQVRIHEGTIKNLKKLVNEKTASTEEAEGQPDIWKAIGMIVNVQEGLMSAVIDLEAADIGGPCVSNSAGIVVTGKHARGGGGGTGTGAGSKLVLAPVPVDPEAAEKKKMRATLKEAEKKLILFNMDLGKAPVMNKDTLARNVTVELGKRVKEGKHDYHIGDAEEVIDDILSCSQLEFMGTSTKKFFNSKNPADPRNNTMYTMPVRMEFADREIRFQSELSIRKICKVNCAVPYPKQVRTIMDNLIAEGKKSYPDSFIRTKVDPDRLTVEAFASVNKKWIDLGLKKDIFPGSNCLTTDSETVSDSQATQAPLAMECESQNVS
jgi:hypothetical protein